MDFKEKYESEPSTGELGRFLTVLSTVLILLGTAWIVFSMLGGCTPY